MMLRKTRRFKDSFRNFTEPSPKSAFAPPGWKENGSWLAPAWLVVPKAGSPGWGYAPLAHMGRHLLLSWPETPRPTPLASPHRQARRWPGGTGRVTFGSMGDT